MHHKNSHPILAVIGLLFLSACQTDTPPVSKPFALNGNWKLDSAYQLANPNTAPTMLASIVEGLNEAKPEFQFKAGDSTLLYISDSDSLQEKFYLQDTLLYISTDNTYMPYQLKALNDSLVNLISKDSLVLKLRKQ